MKKSKMILILLVAITIVVATASKPSQAGIIVTINEGVSETIGSIDLHPGSPLEIGGVGVIAFNFVWASTAYNLIGFDVVSNVTIDGAWSNIFWNDCGGGVVNR